MNTQSKPKNKRYNVISPDGFSIERTMSEFPYRSMKQARKIAEAWVQRYKQQGYYSSVRYGRIDYADILDYCTLECNVKN